MTLFALTFLSSARLTRILILVLGAFSLSACVDIEQNIELREDGSAKLQLQLALHDQFLLLQGGQASAQTCAQFFVSEHELKKHANISQVENRFYQQAGIYYCELSINVQQFDQIEPIQALMLRSGQIKSTIEDFQTDFTLRKQGDSAGVFRQHIRNKTADSNKSMLESQAEIFTNSLKGQMLAGHYWTTTVHAFRIDDTNGQLDAEHTRVSWRMPLYEMLRDQNYTLDMQASFALRAPWYKRWVQDILNWMNE